MNKRHILFFDIPIFIIAIISILNSLLSIYLKNEILIAVNQNTNYKYNLIIDHFGLSLINRSIRAESFSFFPKDSSTSSIIGNSLEFENVNVWGLFVKHKFDVGMIHLKKSKIIIRANSLQSDSIANADTSSFSIYDLFKNKFRSVNVGLIKIDNPEIKFYRNKDDSSLVVSTTNGQIRIVNFKVDADIAKRQDKNFSADSLNVYLKDIKHIIGDSLYTFSIPTLLLSYSSNRIFADSIFLIPNYSKNEFNKKVGYETDRFVIFANSILFEDIDTKKFIENFVCNVSVINIDSLNVAIYRNKYLPGKKKTKKFIRELISDLVIPLRVSKLNFKKSFVQYEELNPPSEKPGKIEFTDIYGSFDTLTNYLSDSNMVLHFHAQAKLNGISPFTSSMSFPMNKSEFHGTYRIKNVPMIKFNSIVEESASATITNGEIDSMNVSIHADKISCRENIELIYHDLRIAAKDIENNDTSKITLRIKTFFANKFLIKNSNPEKGKPVRSYEVIREYDNEKFMINNIWKTTLMGVERTIK